MPSEKETAIRRTDPGSNPPYTDPRVWVPVVLVIIHGLLLPLAPVIPAHRLLFLIFFFTVVLLPGYLLSSIIARRAGFPMRAFLCLICGTAITYGLLTILAILRWKLRYIGLAAPFVSIVLIVLRYRQERINPPAGDESIHLARKTSRTAAIVLTAALVFVCLLVAFSGDPLLYTSDSPDHIAYIRTISLTGDAFPDRFLYHDGGTLTRDIRKGLAHAMWGALNVLTGRIDVLPVWPIVSVIGSVFMLLALFCFGSILIGSAATGLIAVFLYLLVYNDGFTNYQLVTLAYTFPFGKIFYIALLTFVIRYLMDGGGIYLALSVLASVAATGTHINHFLLTGFITAVLSAVAYGHARPDRRRRLAGVIIPSTGLGIILANLPYLLLRYVRDYAPNNVIHSHVQGIFNITDSLVIVNPLVFYQLGGPLFLFSIVSMILLWTRSRRDEPVRYLSWSVVAVIAVVFNPLLVPLVMKHISYLLLRFEFAVPSMLLPAYLLRTLWERARGRDFTFSRGRAAVGWVAVLLFAVLPLHDTPRGFAYSPEKLKEARAYGYRTLSDIYQAINERVPGGSTIASDPVTSYGIPAFTDQFVACTFDQHSIPNDSTALKRILDHRDIVSPAVSLAEILNTLDRYGSAYLLIDGRIPTTVPTMFWRPDSTNARLMMERLDGHPEYFVPVYRTGTAALFAVNGSTPRPSAEDKESVPRFLGPFLSPDSAAALTPSGVEGVLIRSVDLGGQPIHPGEKLPISIEWVSDHACAPRSYAAFMRFDADYEKGSLYRDWYSKLYRKVHEARCGERFRFTVDHLPLSGIYPPDKWQPFRVIRDRFTIVVPPDLSPGLYHVRVKLVVKTQYANHTIRDFLNDRDSLSGTIMTEVHVE